MSLADWVPRRRRPGRLRERLAALLREKGMDIDAEDIIEARGWYRSSPYSEAYRWEARGRAGTLTVENEHGRTLAYRPDESVTVMSWDTMGECVRNGFSLSHFSQDLESMIDAHANERRQP